MTAAEDERSLFRLDQDASEADRRATAMDQTLSDSDRSSSERDQVSADHDQQAADMDQRFRDGTETEIERQSHYEQTRQMRSASALERDVTSFSRNHTAVARDRLAHQRDQLALARDLVSAARDELAAALDAEIERQGQPAVEAARHNGIRESGRAKRERQLLAQLRTQAAAQRKAAAEDRVRAARDRQLAAKDRAAYADELASAEVDEVTGALRRRVGLSALQREMDRARRTKELLTVVFIDVDGLKQVNDQFGHAAGDELLRTMVQCVTDEFRSYDLIFRSGGDEFVCSLTGDALEGIDLRFRQIAARLSEAIPGATISTGASVRRPADTLETLIGRADAAMLAARRNSARPRRPE
jgi:diguanylate cyclase (GGDEF)-like protein